MKTYQKFLNSKNSLLMLTTLVAVQAHAELPETVKTALEGAKADGMEAGWLVVGIIAALFVISIVKRLLR